MNDEPIIGVLALQGDFREHEASLRAAGAQTRRIRRASELAGIHGLVLPGGESTTMSKLLLAFDLFDPIREALRQGLPVYGSCAGMIMLSTTILAGRDDQRSFGAIDMTVRRNAFGPQPESFEADLAVDGIEGGPMRAVFIRAPWVESVAQGVTVLASVSVDGTEHPVAVRQGNAIATSFHPEVTGDTRMHRLLCDLATSCAVH